jgi:ubiquinone/menaquinone biosynthesis C-methylase UbiE
MNPAKSFNIYATSYDDDFSNSEIGKLQRARVHHFLKKYLPASPLNILEINCGTGIDALWLAKQGHKVLATDIAQQMIDVCETKLTNDREDRITFKVCDSRNVLSIAKDEKFDLIFSNFSGLNCLNKEELIEFSKAANQILKPKGKIIACVFGTKCCWERFYFLLKLEFKKINRRKNNGFADIIINGEPIRTFYYSPQSFAEKFTKEFLKTGLKPVGLFTPPSYLNNVFAKIPFALTVLNFLERVFSTSVFANYADHFIVCFEKR